MLNRLPATQLHGSRKGINAGNTVVGGMVTSTNRSIEDKSLESLATDAYTGGLDLLTHWKDKEFYIDARLSAAYKWQQRSNYRLFRNHLPVIISGLAPSILNSIHLQPLSGCGGKFMIGKGSKGFWRYSTGATWLSPGLELNDLGYMNTSDEFNQENVVSYLINQPVAIFRLYSVSLEQFNTWNFNGTYLGSGCSSFIFITI